jgi:hypothetical protein
MRYLALLLTTLSLLACGDDEHLGGADAGPSADASTTPDGMEEARASIFALGTDSNSAGVLARLLVPEMTLTQNFLAGVASNDSVVRAFNGKLYVVNRFGQDNVTIVDPSGPALVAQISTGAGTNPQDLAVVGNKIYVCALNSGSIIVLDEDAPTATPGTIDISSYDTDGIPNCGSIIARGGQVFATLGLFDANFASQGGKVVVIASGTDTIETSFDLTNKNPFGLLVGSDPGGAFGGDLFVGTTEDFGTGNGCIERITTGATPASAGCLVTNATLGGFATTLGLDGDTLWAAVSTSFTEGKLVSVSAVGVLDDTSLTPATQYATDFAVCPTGHIVTNDTTNGSVVVFDAAGANVTTTPIDIGLPPVYTNGLVCF